MTFASKLFYLLVFFLSKTTLAEIRELDWCNVVTCHMDTAQAYVWRLKNYVLGEHILNPSPENPTPVKVRFSVCYAFSFMARKDFVLTRCRTSISVNGINNWSFFFFTF